jgi:hypothetical protein
MGSSTAHEKKARKQKEEGPTAGYILLQRK